MAIVQNPITGRSSGTYAGAVFATQFGKNILRSKPVSVSVSQSDASKLAREKFSKLALELKELMPVLGAFFTSKEFGMPVFSYMLKQAYSVAVSVTGGIVTIDRSKLLVGQDALGLAEHINLSIASGAIQVDFDQPEIENLIGTDNTLDLAFYNASTGNLLGIKASVASTSQGFAFSSSLIGATDDVNVYAKPSKVVKFKASSELCVVVA